MDKNLLHAETIPQLLKEFWMTSRILNMVLLVLLFGMSAQVSAVEDSAEAEKEEDEQVEVIEVTGERPLSWFRSQLTVTRDAYFDTLNSLIKDEELHIECSPTFRRKSLFSLNKVGSKTCQPKFTMSIRSQMIQENSAYSGRLTRIPAGFATEYKRRYNKKLEQLKEEAAKAAVQSPELGKRLQDVAEAQKNYRWAHYQKFGRWSKYAKEFEEESDD